MVKQGDIVKLSFNPQKGHEQAGFRPAVVVSNDVFNRNAKLAILCPITNTCLLYTSDAADDVIDV